MRVCVQTLMVRAALGWVVSPAAASMAYRQHWAHTPSCCCCYCCALPQALSTFQLSPQQLSDELLDVLTGFQLVDGALRLFVLEGPAAGKGMQMLVPALAQWALDDQEDEQISQMLLPQDAQQQEERWLPRHVLHNPSIRLVA